MKKISKLLSLLAVLALGATALPTTAVASAEETKYIDMYLVAGQSNAVGLTLSKGKQTQSYGNVMCAFELEEYFREDGGTVTRSNLDGFDSYCKAVTLGLGLSTELMGPEYGMAGYLNDSYSGDRKAIIYKYGAGGTSLLDNEQELSARFGNWYPSSLWEEGYTPDITRCYAGNDATGLLYYGFIKNFEKVYNELKAQGYTPVVKGVAWMQGCCNTYPASTFPEYKEVLKELIVSVRKDIYAITGNLEDKVLPFVIGKIARSFGAWENAGAIAINEIQQQVADEMDDRVECIETADLIIVDKDGNVKGTDLYHFNYEDDITLGRRFAEKICVLGGKNTTAVYCNNGTYEFIGEGAERVIFLKENEHHKLVKFDVNGVSAMESVQNGFASLPDVGTTIVDIGFALKDSLAVSYNLNVGKGGGLQAQPKTCYEGETLALKLFVNDGYEVKNFDYNGTSFTYNAEKKVYEVTVEEAGTVNLTIGKAGQGDPTPPQDDDDDEKTGGCGCASGGADSVLAALGVALIGVLFKRK